MHSAEEIRRVARRMRRQGWTARELGSFSDAAFDALRTLCGCEDASNLLLADAIDRVIVLEAGE